MTKAKEKEHYRITIDVVAKSDGVNRCGDFEHHFYMIENQLVPYTVGAEDVKYKVELLSTEAEKDLGWHPSTEHPPVDEEVIVLTDIITKGGLNVGFGRIAFGHIVNKDIAIDYNGWNIDGVRYWMPMPEIPKEGMK